MREGKKKAYEPRAKLQLLVVFLKPIVSEKEGGGKKATSSSHPDDKRGSAHCSLKANINHSLNLP